VTAADRRTHALAINRSEYVFCGFASGDLKSLSGNKIEVVT
jgi:hypothetical protein